MRRKLLILAALVGVSILGFDRPATAIITCGYAACNGVSGDTFCRCGPNTPAAGMLTPCYSWFGDCNYL
jgi:hypothetical protein